VANRAYTWAHGRSELAAHKKAWLRAACRERRIDPKGMNRRQMIKALLKRGS
jgi:hypothetical protein